MKISKTLEWTHKDGDTYYRVTATLLTGKPDVVTAMIQVKGAVVHAKADHTYLPLELGTHVIRLLNLFAKTQKEKANAPIEQANEDS